VQLHARLDDDGPLSGKRVPTHLFIPRSRLENVVSPNFNVSLEMCWGRPDGCQGQRRDQPTRGFDFAARRTRRAYGDRHASFVAVLALRGMYCRPQNPAVVPPPQGVRHAPWEAVRPASAPWSREGWRKSLDRPGRAFLRL
jgi:hypothetical protein